jgi:hypothetical protein
VPGDRRGVASAVIARRTASWSTGRWNDRVPRRVGSATDRDPVTFRPTQEDAPMRPRSLLTTTTIAALLLAAPGLAQVSVSDLREIEDDDLVVQPFNRTVDDLEDMDLKTAAGEEIGEVEEVLMDRSGQPVALAIEIDDLFDLDDEERVFRFDQVRLDGDDLVTDLSKSEIEALPVWDD